MIVVFNIFSIFNLITLTYMKFCTNLIRNLTNYINQHKYVLLWFFNCFYLCQVIKSARIINRKNFTFATKFTFLIGLISVKCLQSTKFNVTDVTDASSIQSFLSLLGKSVINIQAQEYLSRNN